MSRPKGSKNKPKINMDGVRNYQQPIQNPSYEKIKSEIEGTQQVQTVVNTLVDSGTLKLTPGFTEEMAKKGALLQQIEAFCAKKGFPPSELIEKFEELEFEILAHKAFEAGLGRNKPKRIAPNGIFTPDSPYGPDTPPETEKRIQDTPEFKKGQEKAENGSEKKNKDTMPAGLSKTDMLKWHRNNKNQ